MQAGAREYPAPPFPKQHQRKPGAESVLNPSPMYDAPFYLGSRKLENKVALITGGDSAPAGGDRTCVRVSRFAAVLELHHRRNSPHHRRLYRRLENGSM